VSTVAGLQVRAPLTPAEERELLPTIMRGREAAQRLSESSLTPAERRRLRRHVNEGNDAESLLLCATLGLVRRRVKERGFPFATEDLELAGVEGLVNALRRFDPAKGTRFSTYAYAWITKLVNQAIRQQAGLSEYEMDLVLGLQKLLRTDLSKTFGPKEVATKLGISLALAREIIELNHRLADREADDITNDVIATPSVSDHQAPKWVIAELKALCGTEFDAFWQFAHKTMSLEEIAKSRGISRQAMSKRLEKCRQAVRSSPQAQRLQAWLEAQ
jgi:RNA polymerase sigma factor (sigma-70 family)